ncbi:MAG: hypothetical protein IPO08_18490 [Xanthomonadales bacterium]|nr:hypothetical protein [Xanthomonadales bacterium]
MSDLITRAEYVATLPPFSSAENSASHLHHRRYMAQFVTQEIIEYVGWAIGVDTIQASTDQHLNDIPLWRWDVISPRVNSMAAAMRRKAGECASLSFGVCIAKEAARQIKTTL